jgi:aminoglycoside 3-N-acetyltransferase
MHLVPGDEVPKGVRPVTRSEIVRDLRTLGVRPASTLMVHTRMSAIGWVVGGADVVVMALRDVLGSDGTLMAYAGWDENPWHLEKWPEAWRRAYLEELPPFDPRTAAADRDVGRIPERIRTWPGALRSSHPESNVVAIGARAEWLVDPHPWDFPHGPGSPLARLADSDGQVLMLGTPLGTITLLHHAEHLAEGPDKRFVKRSMPVPQDGRTVWRTYEDIDTSANGAFPYEEVLGTGVDPFEAIAREAIAEGIGRRGRVGDAESAVFEAAPLVPFAVRWLEERFGQQAQQRGSGASANSQTRSDAT